jgi:N-acetylglutamate synthase-like GNAT family acetyltransferase
MASFRAAIEVGREIFVVAEAGGIVRGFGSVVPMMSELRAVYVEPEAGRRGAGSAILKRLEEIGRERGLNRLETDASLNGEGFYLRNGYASIGRSLHRLSGGGVMACVRMGKDLTADDGNRVLNYGGSVRLRRKSGLGLFVYGFVFMAVSMVLGGLCVVAYVGPGQNLYWGYLFVDKGDTVPRTLIMLILIPWLMSGYGVLSAIRRRRQR